MSTILEADETGALRLPPSLLPHPGPHRRYRVAAADGQVVVDEATAEAGKAGIVEHRTWLERLEKIRARGVTDKTGMSSQQMWDEIREDRC
ncbi:MAG: hypothetical protein K8R23_16975 [Chthoniobacter sp.]|nr:hypothetical protein [Chthoniobacter sp.]